MGEDVVTTKLFVLVHTLSTQWNLGRTGSIQDVRGTVGENRINTGCQGDSWRKLGREKLVIINGERGDGSTFSRVII